MSAPQPLIFDLHRFALDDGPGIRTTVFLKGCPLACSWCHNPEAMRDEPELALYPQNCIHCGTCSAVCPATAITDRPTLQLQRHRCTSCATCADSCPTLAIQMIGTEYPLAELMELLLRDRQFFAASGGGVTFSGGEPTRWMSYLNAALQALQAEQQHTAIQTCGLFEYDLFSRQILPFTDLIMFDLKFINTAVHRQHTGQDNTVILENFRRLTQEAGSKVVPRVPLVPGITATSGNLLEIAAFLADLGYARCDLLSYNPSGREKRRRIGMALPYLPERFLGAGEEAALRKLFRDRLLQRIDTAA